MQDSDEDMSVVLVEKDHQPDGDALARICADTGDSDDESSYEYPHEIAERPSAAPEQGEAPSPSSFVKSNNSNNNIRPAAAAGLKRSASMLSHNGSFAETDDRHDDKEETGPYHKGAISLSAKRAPSHADGGNSKLPPSHCSDCREENHIPILDCAMAKRWHERIEREPVLIQVVPERFVQCCLEAFVRDFAVLDKFTLPEALRRLRKYQWNTTQAAIGLEIHQVGLEIGDIGREEEEAKEVEIEEAEADSEAEPVAEAGGINLPEESSSSTNQQEKEEKPSRLEIVLRCDICLENIPHEEMGSLVCGHRYCRECWTGHLRANLVGPATLTTTCPRPKCRELVSREMVAELYPDGLKNFNEHLVISFSAKRYNLRCCPGPDCEWFAVRNDRGMLDPGIPSLDVAHCGSCQTQYCFHCGEAPHGSAPCPIVVNLLPGIRQPRKEGSEERDRVKVCPHCQALIQKIGGCNRLSCRCGHAFCWLCLGDMSSGYGHKCAADNRNTPQATEVEAVRVDLNYVINAVSDKKVDDAVVDEELMALKLAVKRMERFGHFYNHYFAHHHGQIFAADQQGCLHSKINSFTSFSGFQSGADADFIGAANETLVTARRLLKYTFAYAFEMGHGAVDANEKNDDNDNQVGLFESHQERLVRFTEELSGLSEQPLTPQDRTRLVEMVGSIILTG